VGGRDRGFAARADTTPSEELKIFKLIETPLATLHDFIYRYTYNAQCEIGLRNNHVAELG
jgi:hypothetical protein